MSKFSHDGVIVVLRRYDNTSKFSSKIAEHLDLDVLDFLEGI